MAHLLLLGAGFSRNWGGWLASEAFEYLLGSPQIVASPQLTALLWRCQEQGGFEDALAEVRSEYFRSPNPSNRAALTALQDAVTKMFEDMNRAFLDLVDWEPQNFRDRKVGYFLTRFDAIFTLNQDVLLEQHYCNENVSLSGARRWDGAHLPGMQRRPNLESLHQNSWARSTWVPAATDQFVIDPKAQPIFKLHGSSNWWRSDGSPMLILGAAKVREIDVTPVLNWYAQQFERLLAEPDSRLMVIGYGFRDPHINQAIARAVEGGLRLFIIAPEGADIARRQNQTRAPGHIVAPTELEKMIERGLIGASRRGMREIFGSDAVEHSKVMRFFEPAS